MGAGVLDVLIIGCGNIAGGFDAGRPVDAMPLTHAGAFSRNGGFRLVECVEPDDGRRQAFMDRWGVGRGHATTDTLDARPGDFDIISICSPTALHAGHLQAALELRPRLIFCEKPITPALAETRAWVERCEQAGVLLAVNHTRRWAPDVVRLRDELRAGVWGAVRCAVGYYNKGILNNGSHLVDILRFLLGSLEVVTVGAAVYDFWPDDPTVPALLRTAGGVPVHLATAHAADYALFELQIVTATATLTMEDGGLGWRIRRAIDDPNFRGYRTLGPGEQTAGEYWQAMSRAAANLFEAILQGAPLASSGRSALEVQGLCAAIRTAAVEDPHSHS